MPAAVVVAVGQEGQVLTSSFSHPLHQLGTIADASSSVPNSQSSSLDASQASQTVSSNNTSQSIPSNQSSQQDDPPHCVPTQSRDRVAIPAPPRDLHLTTSIPTENDSKSQARPISLNGAHGTNRNHADEISHGQKRTASGHVKTPSSSLPTSPEDGVALGHRRHTSTASATSQVGSLSDQLRTRLSYAMVKVQKGWESRTIDEIENLPSQQASPVSTTSSLARHTPRIDPMDTFRERCGFAQSSERTTAAPSYNALSAPTSNGGVSGYGSYAGGNTLAYVQVRNNEASSRYNAPHQSPRTGPKAPSLAPPFDANPRNPRRTNPNFPQPPPLNTNNLSSISASSSTSAKSATPATPPQRRTPTIRTPSQKATAMEKDAIESLLFMASPGNSQHHPTNSQLPGTPLRKHFLAAEKRVGFADENTAPVVPRTKHILDTVDLGSERNIDMVLDQMPDDESSSDEESLPRPRNGILS
ncbi:MAG: hypothetical protein MMC33_008392 [Icmadophila ericetorum]|nr:hypothetical protein [Icmadophila ericetorum]